MPPEEEIARLLPVLEALRRATDAPLSVDTRKGEVARQALAAGADLINDVGALSDPALGRAVAEAGCPLVLMHSRGELATMQRGIHFDDLLGEVRSELAAAVARAAAAGVDPSQIVLDPGLGFGKTWEQNLELLRRLPELAALGRPLLVGASRKSFLARAAQRRASRPPPRTAGWAAASRPRPGRAASGAAAIVRVHDVAETVQLLASGRRSPEAAGGDDLAALPRAPHLARRGRHPRRRHHHLQPAAAHPRHAGGADAAGPRLPGQRCTTWPCSPSCRRCSGSSRTC